MADTKNISTREEQSGNQDYDPKYIQAKKAEFAAVKRDGGNQHNSPLVTFVNGQPVYTRENF